MHVDDHAIVSLSYEVREGGPQGALLERMDVAHPFHFMFGVGKMLPAWERRIFGLKPGMGFTFLLSPEEAYGQPSKDQIWELPIQHFQNEREQIDPSLLVAGQFVTLTASDGKAVNAKILRWNDETVTLDANHALAGMTLFFAGAVLAVRPATVDELIQKRYLGEGG
ncbi:FKBP-type peptidyl-prolyl cis-trans isomerase [Neolewinella lacunae]|uniref:Peptidyl-prolyl cis-trans isomerase n=1 Tax=Neolewinella lacunae TaxID=1517758 RepID=A0A923T7S0_9BACT|nr:FKBP-type peptidyl-prolyl cis-trans isomerase [Neolewinella lacunae]MBC6993849.1 FKBP-type peptidyl-prolyl cis-trans isomerase [Neolewinella lacunae]MDN3637090.1 FKBP-type peptidyl-prolyl cis-trans isomerase [Neolewinella lacunae]